MACRLHWSAALVVAAVACGPAPAVDDGGDTAATDPDGEGPGSDDAGSDTGSTPGSTGEADSSSGATGEGTTDGGHPPAQCEEGDDGWGAEEEGGGEDGAEDTAFGMGDDMPLAANVYDVQQGTLDPGALVALGGVVVTSPSTPSESGAGFEIFVQEPDGGPYSGLRLRALFDPGTVLVPGDLVDVVGRVRGQNGFYVLALASNDDLTYLGTGEIPTPVVVSASELGAEDPQARPYEGVAVRVEQVTVTDPDPCDGEFVIDETVRVDDRFVPDALPMPEDGQVLSAVEGVLVYALDAYELAPPRPDAVE